MTYDKATFESAFRHATGNKAEIKASTLCGCFYCLETYPPQSIERWLVGEDTALCAECQIDSVIGDASGFPVSDKAFLQAMHSHWFS